MNSEMDVVQLSLVQTVDAACSGGHPHRAEGPAGVSVLVVVHDSLPHADGGLVGHIEGGEEVLGGEIFVVPRRQQSADERGPRVGADDVVAVVDVVGVGGVAHGGGCPQEAGPVLRAQHRDLPWREGASGQAQSSLELPASAPGDEGAQQVQHTAPEPLLYRLWKLLPAGVSDKPFQAVVCDKFHWCVLLMPPGRTAT